MVTEDPPAIMTNFEPAGRPGEEQKYYLTEKENRCVVCGRLDSYIRKNIVPHEYRRSALSSLCNGSWQHIVRDMLLKCL